MRELVIGEDDKKATAKDISDMQQIVSTAMSQGVFGVSSGLIYPPNAFATVEELGEVAKAATGRALRVAPPLRRAEAA